MLSFISLFQCCFCMPLGTTATINDDRRVKIHHLDFRIAHIHSVVEEVAPGWRHKSGAVLDSSPFKLSFNKQKPQ